MTARTEFVDLIKHAVEACEAVQPEGVRVVASVNEAGVARAMLPIRIEAEQAAEPAPPTPVHLEKGAP